MTFVNRIASVMVSQGAGRSNDALFLKQSFVLSGTTTQVNVLPASGAFSPTLSKGKIRFKVYPSPNPGTSPSATFSAVLSDGTNFVEVARHTVPVMGAAPGASASIPNYADRLAEFEVDINASYLFLTSTLTGTSPQCLMDVEISGSS